MPNVKFNLDGPNPRLIFLVFRIEGRKFKYSTGQKIDQKYWDKKRCRVKQSGLFPQYRAFNDLLDMLERVTQDAYRQFIVDHVNDSLRPTYEELKACLRLALDKATLKDIATAEHHTLLSFVEKFIAERKVLPEFTKGTIKVYSTTYNHLVKFNKQWHRKLDFDTVDLDFAFDFKEYLYKQNFANNYVHKLLQQLRVFLNDATARGINTNMAFKSRRFQVKKEEVDNIYLTVEELKEMYYLDLSHSDRLAKARDLFILGAFTGLRFSDFSTLKKSDITEIEGHKVIKIITQKTRQAVVIPVHPFVQAIFDRHDGPPKGITNQRLNDYIKELSFLCSWGKDPVYFTHSKGGVNYDKQYQKAQKVTTHTARRSFATNAYKSGDLPSIAIMKITGHRTEKQFLKYIKVSASENAAIVAKSKLFQTFLKRVD